MHTLQDFEICLQVYFPFFAFRFVVHRSLIENQRVCLEDLDNDHFL